MADRIGPAPFPPSGGGLPTVIYVAGYGRCGSTVLDVVLGHAPGVFGAGEMALLFRDWGAARARCACGAPYRECPVWRRVVGEASAKPEEAARLLERVEGRRGLGARADPGAERAYRELNRAVFASLGGLGYRVVVDSSKTAGRTARRPVALAGLVGLDVRVVHLRRALLPTLGAVARTANREAEGLEPPRPLPRPVRALLGYPLAHRAARATRAALGAGRYLAMSHEALLASPERQLYRIADLAGIDLGGVVGRVRAGGAFRVGHHVSGNRVRLAGEIVLGRV